MRRFLLISHRVPVDGIFSLNDLAGAGGRMDEVARAVSTAFTLSNDVRRDTEMTLLFVAAPPPKSRCIVLHGSKIRYLNPDERSTAALLKNALNRSLRTPLCIETSPGITVSATDPWDALRKFLAGPNPFWLVEDGDSLVVFSNDEFSAVLSDPENLTEEETQFLASTGIPRYRVSPRSLRSSQVIDLVHHAYDANLSIEHAERVGI